MEYQKKKEENDKRQRLFVQLAAVEERLAAGAQAGGCTEDATQALLMASTLLNSDFVLTDIKSANRELDFCENALASCSDGVGGVISLKDILNAFDKQYGDFCSEEGNDLKKYCISYSSYFVTCPPWHCLKIGLESLQPKGGSATQESQQDGSQQPKPRRKTIALADAAADEQANAADEVVEDSERDQETVRELHRLYKGVLDELITNNGNPIDYWRFVFDPTSKGKTFMNMLHVNHILQNKELSLVTSESTGQLFLCKSSFLTEHSAAVLEMATTAFILTDEKYNELTNLYAAS